MGETAHLIAAKDRNGRFSGYYKCSRCAAEFRPNPKYIGELSKSFAAHVQFSHSDDAATRKVGNPNRHKD
jgi:uncharacterized C2H2 Zn-finger protein